MSDRRDVKLLIHRVSAGLYPLGWLMGWFGRNAWSRAGFGILLVALIAYAVGTFICRDEEDDAHAWSRIALPSIAYGLALLFLAGWGSEDALLIALAAAAVVLAGLGFPIRFRIGRWERIHDVVWYAAFVVTLFSISAWGFWFAVMSA